MDKVDKAVWNYILKNGGLTGNNSYYCGLAIENFRNTPKGLKVLKEINEVGIDWEKTKPAIDDYHMKFTDSYAAPDEQYYVRGTLVLNNGSQYDCQSELDYEGNFLETMRNIINFIDRYMKD